MHRNGTREPGWSRRPDGGGGGLGPRGPSPGPGLSQGSQASWCSHPREVEPSVWLTPLAPQKGGCCSGQLAQGRFREPPGGPEHCSHSSRCVSGRGVDPSTPPAHRPSLPRPPSQWNVFPPWHLVGLETRDPLLLPDSSLSPSFTCAGGCLLRLQSKLGFSPAGGRGVFLWMPLQPGRDSRPRPGPALQGFITLSTARV